MTQAVVRGAGIEDAEGIAAVHVASWRETYRGMVPDAFLENLSVARRAAQWMGSLSDPLSVYLRALVAELNEQIVGFANYGFPPRLIVHAGVGVEGESRARVLRTPGRGISAGEAHRDRRHGVDGNRLWLAGVGKLPAGITAWEAGQARAAREAGFPSPKRDAETKAGF